MDTITICSVCYKSGGYETFSDIRRPLSQCDACGKKCLGFIVEAKQIADERTSRSNSATA